MPGAFCILWQKAHYKYGYYFYYYYTLLLLLYSEGNFPDMGAAGSLHEFLMKLHKTYGSIASFWFGKTFTVSIASPELFKEHIGLFDRPRK